MINNCNCCGKEFGKIKNLKHDVRGFRCSHCFKHYNSEYLFLCAECMSELMKSHDSELHQSVELV